MSWAHFWYPHERLSRLDTASSNTGTSDSYGDRPSGRSTAYTRRENRLAALSSRTDDDSSRDYKKLYESALSENQKLKSKLQDAQVELADIKLKLDKIAQQKQEKTSDRSSMLEMEKREKRTLERKLSEMEEEMKSLITFEGIHLGYGVKFLANYVQNSVIPENAAVVCPCVSE
ncbi:UNVERIFIED_CONTAM: hypothetical protein K2H54_061722 [Gekko kuhli]